MTIGYRFRQIEIDGWEALISEEDGLFVIMHLYQKNTVVSDYSRKEAIRKFKERMDSTQKETLDDELRLSRLN